MADGGIDWEDNMRAAMRTGGIAVVNTDGSPIAGGGGSSGSATSASTSPTVTTTVSTILASNSSRKDYTVVNPSTNSVSVFVKRGTGASTTSYTMEVPPGGAWIDDKYYGAVTAITASSTATIQVSQVG